MATYHLYRWSVTGDFFQAPEIRQISLVGFRDQETKSVRTSHVMEVNGREITTRSGSVYILEDMDPDYRKFLEDTGYNIDEDNPIKIKVAL